MTITLKKYGSFNFSRNMHCDASTAEIYETKVWSAVKVIDNIEIDFNFDQEMFYDKETDWLYVTSKLQAIDGEIASLVEKSKKILAALHLSIFNKDISQLNAFFLLNEIQFVGVNGVVAEVHDPIIGSGISYKFGFILESIDDEMADLDPYCKYYTYFSEQLFLSGAYRG